MTGSDRLLAHKQCDAASYDPVAADFDHFVERTGGSIAAKLIELARLEPADRVLDVGTGTGLVALRASPLIASNQVIGIDHSPGMLEQARAKSANSGTRGVSFRQMDAEHLDFADRSFDVVLSLYALLHFPEPLAALREMRRVLRPGGRVVIGVGRGAPPLSWDGAVQGIRRMHDIISIARGRLLTAPQFLHRLMREHGLEPDVNQQPHRALPISRMLHEVGFRHVRTAWLGCCEALDAEEFWRLQVTFDSPARTRLQKASPQQIAALRKDFFDLCQNIQARHGVLVYRHAAAFYVGTRVQT
jgi:SAM-dependent methyltransferase